MKDNALYLEADEDITSAIDKLQKLAGDKAQIVVPKRSTMLQSIINLKLLKKAADNSGKELVLVTNDRLASDLAARVGLAVATSLGGKAVLAEVAAPTAKMSDDVIETDETDEIGPEPEPVIAPVKPEKPKRAFFSRRPVSDKPVPAAVAAVASAAAPQMAAASAAEDLAEAAVTPAKKGGLPKVKVPDFNHLQRRLMWAGLGIFLILGYFGAMFAFSSATVTLYASGTKVDVDTSFTADPGLRQSDMDKGVLAAQPVTFSKDLSAPFTPTGKRDVGTKASGGMVIYNEYDMNPHTLVAGTRLQAPDGRVFRTKADVTVPGATVGLVNGKIQLTPGKSDSVSVEADQNGDTYNEAPARYTVVAYAGDMQAKIYGQGAQMTGGTTKIATVVTQADIDKAKATLMESNNAAVDRDLEGRVPTGYIALAGSGQQSADSVVAKPAVDQEASAATLSIKATYTQLAVLKADFEKLVKDREQKQIGDQNQIYDDGIDTAKLTAGERDPSGRQTFQVAAEAYGGAKLDTAKIAERLKGQRYGDAANIATAQPGVQRAEISLWPAWSTSLPGRTSKIKVNIQIADAKDK